jgi:hypothetical protein
MKLSNRGLLLTISLSVILMLIVIVFNSIYINWIRQEKDNEIAYMIQAFNWKEGEALSRYRKMMIRILAAYSYPHNSKYGKSMTKDMKIKYINFNWEASQLLKISPFIVPQINKQETAFDPYVDHAYAEIGIGGMKFETAVLAQGLLNYMPEKLKRFFKVEIKTRSDLKDPIINNKCTYILLWWNLRLFGREDWSVLIYRWGGFLNRHWFDGEGKIPVKFTLNGIEYNAYKYYFELASYIDAYERGLLEPNKKIKELWIDRYKKLCKEEINYRDTSRIIKTLKKELREKKQIETELTEKEKRIENLLIWADNELKKISGESKNGGGKESLKKVKNIVKRLLKEIGVKK